MNLFRDPAKARERAGLTQEALAKKIGTNAQRGLPLRTPPYKSHAFDIGKSRRAMGRKLVVKLAGPGQKEGIRLAEVAECGSVPPQQQYVH